MRFEEFIKGFDRRKISIIAVVVCFVIVSGWVWDIIYKKYTGVEKAVITKKDELTRFNRLEEEFLRDKHIIDSIAKRLLSPKGNESPIIILEEIGKRTGVKEKITTLKPLEEKMKKGYRERGVEMRIDGIDLNQLINLLYKIENHKALLIVKGFSMKNRFDNPDLLDITINLSLISKV